MPEFLPRVASFVRRFGFALAAGVVAGCGGGGGGTATATSIVPAVATATPKSIAVQPGASPTPTPKPGATNTPAPPTLPASQTVVGPGFSDVSPHQIVRTSTNVEYVSVPTCAAYPNCYLNALPMYAAAQAGTPGHFVERDAAHRPVPVLGPNDTIESSALAIDGNDTIYEAYITQQEGAYVVTFDTRAGVWGTPTRLGNTVSGTSGQGREGIGIAVDASGTPHVVWSAVGNDGLKHVVYANRAGGVWSAVTQIDDTLLATGLTAIHPTMAFAPNGTLLVAWLVGNELLGYNVPDGSISVRAMKGGVWVASVSIPDTNYGGNPGYAQTTIDQGPSMLVTADGTAHVTYVDTQDTIRYWYSSDYVTWFGDRQPAAQETHDPSLGPDGAGGIYIYGHGTPIGGIIGHGNNLYRMHLAAGTTSWTAFGSPIVTNNNIDCSVTTRWSQYFQNFPGEIDYGYWDDRKPDVEYVGQG